MRHIYLCGHTGSENRGCEAIVRSTSGLLHQCGQSVIYAMTHNLNYDCRVGLDNVLNMMPIPRVPSYVRMISLLRRHLIGDGTWTGRFMHREMFQQIDQQDIIFNIGGDTYCYSTPTLSYAVNQMAEEKEIPTVFWGCSVDERVLTDAVKQKDINRYAAIVARETKSYELLRQIVKTPEKVYLACDPAFTLECTPVQLPKHFQTGNTVGVNISPIVVRNAENPDDIVLQNVYTLIDNILSQSDMHVCLIPHVYDPNRNTQDIRILRSVYQKYAENNRVSLIEEELSCTQLKYIISKCRFFVGARTHPTIAAYSTGVPALAISYSTKSLGIAKDILGDETRYAVPWREIKTDDHLWRQFSEEIMEHEQEIIKRYQEVLPEYAASAERVLKEILSHI